MTAATAVGLETAAPEPADLVLAAARGDQRAWEALVDRYVGLIWAITRNFRLPPDDARDVTQTTWLRLLENIERLKDPSRVGAWLATTARRECIRVVAQKRRSVSTADETVLDGPDIFVESVDDALIAAEESETVRRALLRLPEQCQRLLRLLTQDPPLSYEEVSAALGLPIGSIGPTRGRSLAKLRILIEQEVSEGLAAGSLAV
jgi:RNA polymerase sigma factor (sigma-70 family)